MNVNVKPLAVPGPGADAPGEPELILRYVRRMQRDGRLLLRHISGRADRAVPPSTPPLLPTLFADAGAVAADPVQVEALAGCVDALSREAAPANAATIRLTRAYLRSIAPDDDVVPPETLRRGATLRAILKGLAGIAIFAVAVALWLLAYVDDGRRSLQQLQGVRAEQRATYEELGRLSANAWIPPRPAEGSAPERFRHFCGTDTDGGLRPSNTTEGLRANGLCNTAWQLAMREELVLRRIAGWNCPLTTWLPLGFLDSCRGLAEVSATQQAVTVPAPATDDPTATTTNAGPTVSDKDWARTEIRPDAWIATLTGYVLPLLMGFIGGCAFVLRRLDQKLSSSTLEARDGWHAVLRVLLASMLGGLLGAVWSGDSTLSVSGVSLTLAAAAFFVGFALEAVFTLIEAMVESISGRLRAEAGPPPRPTG
jgi:hypothetical protein